MAKKPVEEYRKLFIDAREEFESMLRAFSRAHPPFVMPSDNRWIPAVDIFETDTEFVIIFDLAHIDPRDIEIVYGNKILLIKGIRREITQFKKRHYHKMEIDYGPFERKISVPVAIDEQNIKTQYKEGFLQIRLLKIADRRGKERIIDIEWKE